MTNHNIASTETDLLTVLSVYATATEPLAWTTAAKTANPPPTNCDGRTREHKAWSRRQIQLIEAQLDATELGYITEAIPATGYEPFKSTLTAAGRRRLRNAQLHDDEHPTPEPSTAATAKTG